MKVLLINPIKEGDYTIGLSIGQLASYLEQFGHSVETELVSLESDFSKFVDKVIQEKYPIIGVSLGFYNSLDFALTFIKLLKGVGIKSHIVVGGHCATNSWKEIMENCPQIDTLVMCEGEETLKELIDNLDKPENWGSIKGLVWKDKGEIKVNPPRKLITELEALPFPKRKIYPIKDYPKLKAAGMEELTETTKLADMSNFNIMTSRGCYGYCSFCSIYKFYGRSYRRSRSITNVVDEISFLVKEHSAKIFSFCDDNFFAQDREEKEKWCYKFVEELEKRKLNILFYFQCRPNDIDYSLFHFLQNHGLYFVFVGTESFIPRTLKLFRKGISVKQNFLAAEILKKLGIMYELGLIIFEPYTTLEEFKQSINICKQLYNEYNYFAPMRLERLRVYAGTDIWYKLQEEKRLNGDLLRGYDYEIIDWRVEKIYRILTNAIAPFRITEPETLTPPHFVTLSPLSVMPYLKSLPGIKSNGEYYYIPELEMKKIFYLSGTSLLNIIEKLIVKLERCNLEDSHILKSIEKEIIEDYTNATKEIGKEIKKQLVKW